MTTPDPSPPFPAIQQKEDLKEGGKFDKKVDKDWTHAYADDLRAETYTEVNASPKADVHQREWRKIMNGDPGEFIFISEVWAIRLTPCFVDRCAHRRQAAAGAVQVRERREQPDGGEHA